MPAHQVDDPYRSFAASSIVPCQVIKAVMDGFVFYGSVKNFHRRRRLLQLLTLVLRTVVSTDRSLCSTKKRDHGHCFAARRSSDTAIWLREIINSVRSHPLAVFTSIRRDRPSGSKQDKVMACAAPILPKTHRVCGQSHPGRHHAMWLVRALDPAILRLDPINLKHLSPFLTLLPIGSRPSLAWPEWR